ncbi:MAG: DegV family protein [Eubacterium sp.]|nr:DegV family protein [Eubacterium sp.]
MGKIAFVTDSNSGITQEQGEALGVSVIPMPFYIDDQLYFEGINLSQEEFYHKLEHDAKISTSMPAPGDVIDLWKKLLADHDQIIYIPMSSGLSSSCQTARMLAEDEFAGKVFVVNNQRISVTQRQSILDGMELARRGMDAREIQEYLERTRFDSSIYITVDTLTYLKRGGRITPAAAAIGTLLRIKPVLQIQGEKLDSFAKCRTTKHAQETMLAAVDKDLKERFGLADHPEDAVIAGAYTCGPEEAQKWIDEVKSVYPDHDVHFDPLSLSIACHIGPGSTAVTISRRLPDDVGRQK